MIRPFLRSDISQVTEESLLENIATPVTNMIVYADTSADDTF